MSEERSRPTIREDDIARFVQLRTELFNRDVNRLDRSLFEGRITLRMWQEEFKTQLRLFHTGMTAFGAGGWGQVTSSQWGRTGAILREQYGYLARFAQDIYDRRETISEAMIAWRSRLYGLKGAYTANVAHAGDVLQYLPYMPRDGSTTCLNGCKCYWDLQETLPIDGMKQVIATWTLTPAEHCEASRGRAGCIDRDGYVVRFGVPEGMRVPARIGGVAGP